MCIWKPYTCFSYRRWENTLTLTLKNVNRASLYSYINNFMTASKNSINFFSLLGHEVKHLYLCLWNRKLLMTTRLNVRWGVKLRRPRCPSSSRWVTRWFMGRSTVLKSKKLKKKTPTLSSYIPRKARLWDRVVFADWTALRICWSLSGLSLSQLPYRLQNRCRSVSFVLASGQLWTLSNVNHFICSDHWKDSSVGFTGFLLSTKECMRGMLSVRSRCPVTQAAWDRGLPLPPKMR